MLLKFINNRIREIILLSTILFVFETYVVGAKIYGIQYAIFYIEITRFYGFAALIYLFFTLLKSPLYSLFPNLPLQGTYSRAKRSLGVSVFIFSFFHSYFTFFVMLNGFDGLPYLNSQYIVSLVLGTIALIIFSFLALTSFDFWVRILGRYWKILHRLIYISVYLIAIHIVLIGTHFQSPDNLIYNVFLNAFMFLFILEMFRLYKYLTLKYGINYKKDIKRAIIVLSFLFIVYVYAYALHRLLIS